MTTHPAQPIGGLSPDALSSMFQAIAGLHNRRAAVALLVCLFAGVLMVALLWAAGAFGFLHVSVFGLLFLLFVFTGINGAGLLLMDQARGVQPRSLTDALVYGLMCIPKTIALVVILSAVILLVFLALALTLFVCKMPGLGPVLFVAVFPASVIIAGLTMAGVFVWLSMALPAMWEGATIAGTVARATTIVRTRLVETTLLQFVVGLFAILVALLVFGVLGIGLIPTLGLSVSIVGAGGFGDLSSIRYGGAETGGYMIAGAVGSALLWSVAGTLVALVYLLGNNLVYLRVTEGLDASATESAMMRHIDEARRKASDMGQRAKDAAEHAREQVRAAASARSTEAAAAPHAPTLAPTCPQCRKAISTDDLFCGECGFRLMK